MGCAISVMAPPFRSSQQRGLPPGSVRRSSLDPNAAGDATMQDRKSNKCTLDSSMLPVMNEPKTVKCTDYRGTLVSTMGLTTTKTNTICRWLDVALSERERNGGWYVSQPKVLPTIKPVNAFPDGGGNMSYRANYSCTDQDKSSESVYDTAGFSVHPVERSQALGLLDQSYMSLLQENETSTSKETKKTLTLDGESGVGVLSFLEGLEELEENVVE